MARYAWCIIVVSLWGLETGWGSKELLTKMSKSFGASIDSCKNELNTGDHIIKDFLNFWHEDYELVNRDFGCMVLCMGQKLGLVDADMKMHHGNAHEFAQKHGADEELSKQLVAVVHDCEKSHDAIEDHCARILEIAKCFRTKIHELKWAPSVTELLEEMLN